VLRVVTNMLDRSPALIPKPKDWDSHISLSGFYFLSLASNYQPDPELAEFLAAGPPPVYIGFGSIVVDDPNAMTELIFEAVRKTGQRALVSKGWGGLGADDLNKPDGVFMVSRSLSVRTSLLCAELVSHKFARLTLFHPAQPHVRMLTGFS
jgi:hypothetical protein